MNVYDFDKTIYDGDSTVDFYFYCIKKDARILKYLPGQLRAFFMYFIKRYTKTEMKERFYCFLNGLDNVDLLLAEFWGQNIKKIKRWYLNNKKSDDVIISASPEFLLKIPCERLDVAMLASKVCKKTGEYDGNNCHGKEKVLRFVQVFSDSEIDEFYSDSYSDTPLAEISKKAYMVKKNIIKEWKFK